MSKNSNNPLLKGLSGMLGDVVVYKEINGQTFMVNKPKPHKTKTERQEEVRTKFRAGAGYAKACKTNPKAAAYYEARLTRKFRSIYAIAMADYLKAPIILSVDTTEYKGQVGNKIYIHAIDDVGVTQVIVKISDAAGVLVEQGIATLSEENVHLHEYLATVPLADVNFASVRVEVKDRPQNMTVETYTIVA